VISDEREPLWPGSAFSLSGCKADGLARRGLEPIAGETVCDRTRKGNREPRDASNGDSTLGC
jgi:hypothetical protein